jgi:hypothetical protein
LPHAAMPWFRLSIKACRDLSDRLTRFKSLFCAYRYRKTAAHFCATC